MEWLAVNNVGKKENGNWIVGNISFTQKKGEQIAIAGESGSGKSSLLRLIGGLLQPDDGTVFFENEKVIGPLDQLLPGHRHIAYLSQHYELRNNYRVHEILSYANLLSALEASELYRLCRIDHLLARRTNDGLSGGEKQRIALARLLTTKPRLLLLDEPFSNLDAINTGIIKSVLSDLADKLGITCMMASHEGRDMLPWADRIVVMKNGTIIQDGSPIEIYHSPENEYVAGLFGDYSLVNPDHPILNTAGLKPSSTGKLMVRPEAFSIVTDDVNGLDVIVDSCKFMGGFYRLSVRAGAQILGINSREGRFSHGDQIRISINTDSSCFIK